jgi:hypothetical protein
MIANLAGRPGGPGFLIRFHVIGGGTKFGFDDQLSMQWNSGRIRALELIDH